MKIGAPYPDATPGANPTPAPSTTDSRLRDRVRRPRRRGDEQARLSLLSEAGLVGVFAWRADGSITAANDEFLRLVGAGRDRLGDRPLSWAKANPSEHGPADAETWCEHARAGETSPFEWEFARADGAPVPALVAITSLDARGDEGVAITLDLTCRRRLEEQLHLARRLESVGRLAAGVAHDFNNVLTAVGGYSELALRNLDDRASVSHYLVETLKQVRKGASLTRQLLAFGRRQRSAPPVIDLGRVVQDLERMLGRLIGEDVQMRLAIDPRRGRVLADPAQIEQIVMNLTVNARDAMPNGGRLTIEIADRVLPEAATDPRGGAPGARYVALVVSDTGVGMDAATRERAFEPFFTTKERGRGTGLGLPAVHDAVAELGGFVRVESEPGSGTSFQVCLPALEAAPDDRRLARVTPLTARAAPARGEGATVLIVEDDEELRELMEDVLAERGYRVLVAEDGESALRIAETHAEPIDLLLTDVVMPRLSGRGLAQRLSAARPGLAVLFVSGYSGPAPLQGAEPAGEIDLLPKPFTADMLAARVRQAIVGGVSPGENAAAG